MVPSPVARGRISIAVQVYKRGNPALSAKGLPGSSTVRGPGSGRQGIGREAVRIRNLVTKEAAI